MERELFEKVSVPTAYMKLAVPVVLSMVLGVVYNMVDTWFISLTANHGFAFHPGVQLLELIQIGGLFLFTELILGPNGE